MIEVTHPDEEPPPSLTRLRNLPPNWNSYGADPPSACAIASAEEALAATRTLRMAPSWINPSACGGVMLAFRGADAFGSIEFYNSGTTVGLLSDGKGEIDVWEIAPGICSLVGTLLRIKRAIGDRANYG